MCAAKLNDKSSATTPRGARFLRAGELCGILDLEFHTNPKAVAVHGGFAQSKFVRDLALSIW